MESLERREFYPEETIEDCLSFPEIIDELTIEKCDAVIELAEARIMEIYEPQIKDKYRRLIQALKTGKGRHATDQVNADQTVYFDESYNIDTGESVIPIRPRVSQFANFHDVCIFEGINSLTIDQERSRGTLCCITGPQQSFWINIKLFVLKLRDGSERRILYIADWYVTPTLRGGERKIGSQLQEIAEMIARTNRCSFIFGRLVPENPGDLERLKQTKQNRGYEVQGGPYGILATKSL